MSDERQKNGERGFKLGLYEKAMPEEISIEDKLRLAKACDFDYMELSIDESDEKQRRLFEPSVSRGIAEATEQIGLPIRTLCLSAHRKYPLGEDNPMNLELLYRAVDFAAFHGIRLIQLAGYDTYYNASTPQTVKRFSQNLRRGVEYAATAGVMLGFETMETPFMNTVEKAMVYIREMSSPYLTVYPDIGNLSNATDDIVEDLSRGEGHISVAHLKETRPGIFRNLEYGQGCVDFESCVKELRRQGVGMYTCEFWYDGHTEPYEYVRRNVRYVKKIFAGTR